MKNQFYSGIKALCLASCVLMIASGVRAQNCNGNKVWTCKTCYGYFGYPYQECDCVPQNQVANWLLAPCSVNNGNHGNGNNGNNSGGACICARIGSGQQVSAEFRVDPNPVSAFATVTLSLNENLNVRLSIEDATGKCIAVLADGSFASGSYEVPWNTSGVSAGFYFLQIATPSDYRILKLAVVK